MKNNKNLDYKRLLEMTGDFNSYLYDSLKTPKAQRLYLEIALEEYEEDGNLEALLLALRTLAHVQGGMSTLADKTKLSRQNLYRALSGDGNPRLDTLSAVLKALGYRLSVQPLSKK
jgi:probable addiction module antidote protein